MPCPDVDVYMLIDTTKCIGCKACQIACQQWNSLPAEQTSFTGSYQNPADLSGANFTITTFAEHVIAFGTLQWLFFINRCRHCETPFCAGACPLSAIYQTDCGAVLIDPALCDPEMCFAGPMTSPRPCQMACPWGVPQSEYVDFEGSPQFAEHGGHKVMKKCTFCYDRLPVCCDDPPDLPVGAFADSRRPACQVACPTGAIVAGPLGHLAGLAYASLHFLWTHGWPLANIYGGPGGASVAGPTRVAWILAYPPAAYIGP